MDTLETNYIKITKQYKDKDHQLRHMKFLVKLFFNTDYENVYFVNGNNTDLRPQNVFIKPTLIPAC